jgi:hypothetical protein
MLKRSTADRLGEALDIKNMVRHVIGRAFTRWTGRWSKFTVRIGELRTEFRLLLTVLKADGKNRGRLRRRRRQRALQLEAPLRREFWRAVNSCGVILGTGINLEWKSSKKLPGKLLFVAPVDSPVFSSRVLSLILWAEKTDGRGIPALPGIMGTILAVAAGIIVRRHRAGCPATCWKTSFTRLLRRGDKLSFQPSSPSEDCRHPQGLIRQSFIAATLVLSQRHHQARPAADPPSLHQPTRYKVTGTSIIASAAEVRYNGLAEIGKIRSISR